MELRASCMLSECPWLLWMSYLTFKRWNYRKNLKLTTLYGVFVAEASRTLFYLPLCLAVARKFPSQSLWPFCPQHLQNLISFSYTEAFSLLQAARAFLLCQRHAACPQVPSQNPQIQMRCVVSDIVWLRQEDLDFEVNLSYTVIPWVLFVW